MQIGNPVNLLAWALIIIGALIIISGIASMLMRTDFEMGEQRRESKGIILIGPIPIVWGYGRRIWIIAAIIAITIFLLAFFWFP
nr:MAG: hypothetical protein AM325_01885 [Candidatus Thorarchaeota archaeon SMTZ1-45]